MSHVMINFNSYHEWVVYTCLVFPISYMSHCLVIGKKVFELHTFYLKTGIFTSNSPRPHCAFHSLLSSRIYLPWTILQEKSCPDDPKFLAENEICQDFVFFTAAFLLPSRIWNDINRMVQKTPLKNPARIPGKSSAQTVRNSLIMRCLCSGSYGRYVTTLPHTK